MKWTGKTNIILIFIYKIENTLAILPLGEVQSFSDLCAENPECLKLKWMGAVIIVQNPPEEKIRS